MNKVLGQLKSGQKVIGRTKSHLVSHKDILPYLKEALSQIEAKNGEKNLKTTIDFGRKIGYTTCVETSNSDEIVYAVRPPRPGLTRFVKKRKPIPCSTIVVQLSARDEDTNTKYDPYKLYVLSTSYIGKPAVSEPTDPKFKTKSMTNKLIEEQRQSVKFWDTHALIYDESIIDKDTITMTKPW